jgi:peptide/nickel transport system permease protein
MACRGATLAPDAYLRIALAARNAGPDATHWLGRDELGRDTLSRLLAGATTTLGETLAVIAVALFIGFLLDLIRRTVPGFERAFVALVRVCFVAPNFLLGLSRAGTMAMAALSAVLLSPGYLAAIVATVYLGPGSAGCVVALGSLFAVVIAYVLPATSESAAMCRAALALFAWVILSVSALDALGLGTMPPRPSWGAMLGGLNGLASLHGPAMLALGCLLATAIAAIMLGEVLGERENLSA